MLIGVRTCLLAVEEAVAELVVALDGRDSVLEVSEPLHQVLVHSLPVALRALAEYSVGLVGACLVLESLDHLEEGCIVRQDRRNLYGGHLGWRGSVICE